MDDATIAAARLGDRDAQAALLAALQDPWYRLCLGLLGDSDRARDATQETALRFLSHLPSFAGRSQLQTWSFGIAINVVREIRRSIRPTVDFEPESRMASAPDASPCSEAELSEARKRLCDTLKDLPDRQREAIVLRFFEDLSVDQTAKVMCCAPGTVKATVHQTLRKLRGQLAQFGGDTRSAKRDAPNE